MVYLSASFGTVARRIGLDRPRVVVPGNPRGRLRAMLDERDALYQRLAAVTVATDDLDPTNSRTRSRPDSRGHRRAAGETAVTATRIDVTPSDGGPPYQVVVGVGVLSELPGLVPKDARTVVVIHAESLGEIARPACGALPAAGLNVHAEPVPGRRGGQDRRCGGPAVVPARQARRDPVRLRRRDRRGSGHRPGRVRGRDLAPRRQGRPGPDHAAGHGRRRGGREDRDRHPRGQEPGRCVPLAGRRARQPGHAGDTAAGRLRGRPGRSDQDRVHRRPGHPGPGPGRPRRRHGPARHPRARADRARDPGQGRGGVPGPDRGGPAGDPELRAHARPRHRAGRGVPVPARGRGRHRHGVRRRAGPAGRAAGRPDVPRCTGPCWPASACRPRTRPGVWPSLRAAMGVDKKARGARLRFVVLDGLARPSILDDPPEELLRQAYREVSK